VAVPVARGEFGNPGTGMSAVGIQYHRNGVGQQTERTQFFYIEL
jgi:hypothetical protein